MIIKVKRFIKLGVMTLMLTLLLVGCGEKDEVQDNEPEEVVAEEKDYLSMETSISYSAGDDSSWSYGNQRKEFPNNETCYVRISTTAIAEKSKGVDNEIQVTYKFTGLEHCKIEVSDGIVKEVNRDENVVEYTKTVTAEKSKKAKEDVVIFKYDPKLAESVTVEVSYDDQINAKYDARNTIYFDAPENTATH